ncbi:MAG: class I SAM-dependent methyltransferase [bacterium]|nr:class I SAM-dependent methyltransferase [bacterium]
MKNTLNVRKDFEIYGSRLGRINFISKLDIKEKVILDVGCGYGWFLNYALSQGAKEIVGLEISDQDLHTARESIRDEKIFFKKGTAISIPYPDKYFDSVTAWEVIEHIPPKLELKMFEEVARVLKSGGVFYLSTPYKSFLSIVFDPAWWLVQHRHYSVEDLKRFGLDNNNFKVHDYKILGRIFSLLLNLNMYFSKWILKRDPIHKEFFRKMSSREYLEDKGYLTIMCKFIKI